MRAAFLKILAAAALFAGLPSGSLGAASPALSDALRRTPAHEAACRDVAGPELTATGSAPGSAQGFMAARRAPSDIRLIHVCPPSPLLGETPPTP